MRGESPLFWVVKVKVTWHSVFKNRKGTIQTTYLPNHSHTSKYNVRLFTIRMWRPYPFYSEVKVTSGTLPIKPCEQDTDFRECSLAFKLLRYVIYDEWSILVTKKFKSKVNVNLDTACENL